MFLLSLLKQMWRTLLYDMTTEEDITSVNKEKQTKKDLQ